MRTFILLILIAQTSLVGCKSTDSAVAEQGKTFASSAEPIAENAAPIFDLIISFISEGEGIDSAAKEKLKQLIIAFNEKEQTDIKPEKVGWGREGEVDYHFDLKNLSTSQKKAFIAQAQEQMGSSRIVHLHLNQKAVHKR